VEGLVTLVFVIVQLLHIEKTQIIVKQLNLKLHAYKVFTHLAYLIIHVNIYIYI